MKKPAWVIGFLCLALIIIVAVRKNARHKSELPRRPETNSPLVSNRPSPAPSTTASTNASLSPVPTPGVPDARPPLKTNEVLVGSNAVVDAGAKGPELSPATVLENMRVAVRAYGSMFNGNPIGTNPEITKALHGDNPKQVDFIREDEGFRINDNGELIDPWGTPFFFHQLSATEMEIRSAGRDRVLYTADDLVTK